MLVVVVMGVWICLEMGSGWVCVGVVNGYWCVGYGMG